jgi:hypothetical protein
MARYAFLIGVSEFSDQRLARLNAPINDVRALQAILEDGARGNFDSVELSLNEDFLAIRDHLSTFFNDRAPGDVLLLYYSGHGILGRGNRLFLATSGSNLETPRTRSISAQEIREFIEESRAQRQIVVLDCCHSGAFAEHAKAAALPPAVTSNTFSSGDAGLYVLTAADTLQFAWDGAELRTGGDADSGISKFTSWLVQGLEKGEAAPDDEQITMDALYRYLSGRARAEGSVTTPQRFVQGGVGDLVISANPLMGISQIDPEIVAALVAAEYRTRLGAVAELTLKIEEGQTIAARAARRILERHLQLERDYQVRRAIIRALEQGSDHPHEAAQLAEEERQRAEAARLAEEQKQRAEAARLTEEQKQRAEAARLAEEEKQRAGAARLAEEERQRAEAARQAEEQRRRAEAEAARQAEEQRLWAEAEAARQAEERRRRAEAEAKAAQRAEERRQRAEERHQRVKLVVGAVFSVARWWVAGQRAAALAVFAVTVVLAIAYYAAFVQPPMQPQTGTLLLQGTPDDAVLAIDGEKVGPAKDFQQKISPGPHELEISANHYQTHHETVIIPAGGEKTAQFALAPRPPPLPTGTLVVAGTPPEATLKIGDKEAGSANGSYELPAGKYKIVIRASSEYEVETQTVDIVAGQPTRVPFALALRPPHPPPPTTGTLVATGTPRDAMLKIGDKEAGSANGSHELPAGKYKIVISASSGYEVKKQTVDIVAGQPTLVQFALASRPLPPTTGTLVVTGIPRDATLKIGGKEAGTANGSHELRAGKYKIVISASSEYEEKTQIVDIVAGQPTSVRFKLTKSSRSPQETQTAFSPPPVIPTQPLQAPPQGLNPPGAGVRRSVRQDTETRVIWHGVWRQNSVGSCTAAWVPTLEILTPPAHGVIRLATDLGVPAKGSGCNNSVYGAALFYRPNPGFVGQDQFTFKSPVDPMISTYFGSKSPIHTVIITVN